MNYSDPIIILHYKPIMWMITLKEKIPRGLQRISQIRITEKFPKQVQIHIGSRTRMAFESYTGKCTKASYRRLKQHIIYKYVESISTYFV